MLPTSGTSPVCGSGLRSSDQAASITYSCVAPFASRHAGVLGDDMLAARRLEEALAYPVHLGRTGCGILRADCPTRMIVFPLIRLVWLKAATASSKIGRAHV